MKHFSFALLVILLFILAGCGTDQHTAPDDETRYSSDTSAKDCYLCGGSIDGGFSANLMLEYDRGYATGSVDFLNDETL